MCLIHACRKSECHLVGYEAHDLIFSTVLQLLWESSSQNPIVSHSLEPLSLEDDEESPPKVTMKSRLSM